jgi:hypothetical protein
MQFELKFIELLWIEIHWKILELWILKKFGQQAPCYSLLLGKINFYQKRIRNLNSTQNGNFDWFHDSLNYKLYFENPPVEFRLALAPNSLLMTLIRVSKIRYVTHHQIYRRLDLAIMRRSLSDHTTSTSPSWLQDSSKHSIACVSPTHLSSHRDSHLPPMTATTSNAATHPTAPPWSIDLALPSPWFQYVHFLFFYDRNRLSHILPIKVDLVVYPVVALFNCKEYSRFIYIKVRLICFRNDY